MDTRQLKKLGDRYRRLTKELEDLRPEIHDEIINHARAGVTPTELVALSGYTRDRVRVICREAGIDPLPQGPKRKTDRSTGKVS